MNFILNNNLFDTIISLFLIINTISTIIISFSEFKKDIKDIKNSTNKQTNNLNYFKLATNILWTSIIIVILINLSNKYNLNAYFTLLYYFIIFFISLKLLKKDFIDLTTGNRMTYIQNTVLFYR